MPRLFLEVSCLRALAGGPPHKFLRAFDEIRRALPHVVPVIVTGAIVRAAPGAHDSAYDFVPNALWRGPRVRPPTLRERVKLAEIALVARATRPPPMDARRAKARHNAAYDLAQLVETLPPARREIIAAGLRIDDDLELHSHLRHWLRRLARNEPTFPLGATIEPTADDTIVFFGFCGGVSEPIDIEALSVRTRVRSLLIVLDATAILRPLACGIVASKAIADALRRHAAAGTEIITPLTDAVAAIVALPGVGTSRPRRVAQLTGLSVEGPEATPRLIGLGASPGPAPKRFALSIGSFKDRRAIAFLLEVWSRARATDADVPRLVLVSRDGLGLGGENPVPDQQGYLVKEAWLRDPTLLALCEAPTDPELRWLMRRTAFVIQPPASHGLGLAATEAAAFGKRCLRERADGASIKPGDDRLGRDLDEWEAAIIVACRSGAIASVTDERVCWPDLLNR